MNFQSVKIAGACLIEPKVFGDERGFFMESWNERAFREGGLDLTFVQDNHSRSSRGVLRGLHYQNPNPQGKLVRILAGAVYDVIIDMRRSSPTFGQWEGFELSAEKPRMLWAPPGVAHGFLTLSDTADFFYKCTNFYSPADESAILWNDPELAIDWPLADGMQPELSAKDRQGLPFNQSRFYP